MVFLFMPGTLFFHLLANPQYFITEHLFSQCCRTIQNGYRPGAIMRFFGPEYNGGVGDFGAKIDAEVAARTVLSSDEIGPKVRISYHTSR
jgi:hypothetical protein